MTDARGRSRKNNSKGGRVHFAKTTTFTPEGDKLRQEWEKLSDAEREKHKFNFEAWRIGKTHFIHQNKEPK